MKRTTKTRTAIEMFVGVQEDPPAMPETDRYIHVLSATSTGRLSKQFNASAGLYTPRAHV